MTQQDLLVEGGKALDILIIGGSLSGLMAAIILKRHGHRVTVLEQAISSEREGMAAGIGLSTHIKRFFDDNDLLKDTPFAVQANGLHILDHRTLRLKSAFPYAARMTTWDATYYRLRANFDALQSAYTEKPPTLEDKGMGVFETAKRVVNVTQTLPFGSLVVTAEDLLKGQAVSYTADLVIAADGGNSPTRRLLQPGIESSLEVPGFLLWRGTVPTASLPKSLLDKIEGHTIAHPMKPYSYAIIYTIPGTNGRLGDGERHINWAWYHWPSSRALIQDILTDVDGHEHRTTLPKGKMRPKIWDRQKAIARDFFHPELMSILDHITEPFVSLISGISSKRACFCNDRLFLIGDALVHIQPNSGQGFNKAAHEAITLCGLINAKADQIGSGEWAAAAKAWERNVLDVGEKSRLAAIAFGSWYLRSWPVIALATLRVRLCTLRQWLASWWRGGNDSNGEGWQIPW